VTSPDDAPATCPACGVGLDTPWSPTRPRLNHEPGSKACKTRAWAREARERDLVRVDGITAVELAPHVDIIYGPTVDSAAFHRHASGHNPVLAFAGRSRGSFVTGAYVPRWASELWQLQAIASLSRREQVIKALAACQRNPELAAAVSSVAILCEDVRDRRAALWTLLNEKFPKPRGAAKPKMDGFGFTGTHKHTRKK